MGPGFKYHVVTIVSIFLALTVGLVVGSLYVSPRVSARQEGVITNLQKTLVKKLDQLQTSNDRNAKFILDMMPTLLHDKLSGQEVAVVLAGDYPDALNSVRTILTSADAHIASITAIDHNFNSPDAILNPMLADIRADDSGFPADRADLAALVARMISSGDSRSRSMLEPLQRNAFIQLQEGDYHTPARYVVLVVGSSRKSLRTSNVDQPLIDALTAKSVTVVACEPDNVAINDLADYKELGITVPGIDRVDTEPTAQFALVAALRGEADDGSSASQSGNQ